MDVDPDTNTTDPTLGHIPRYTCLYNLQAKIEAEEAEIKAKIEAEEAELKGLLQKRGLNDLFGKVEAEVKGEVQELQNKIEMEEAEIKAKIAAEEAEIKGLLGLH
ncbi:hypothetical protein M427DRAFT_70341 [Gonapodya prolifera JEL478]|uniref:Uncharacterized protein n=1 Tax=Gonapodya prolifera (strain JEL478) TaxID=1344416 RepID=A0A139AE52_GONPJ|nr:hypothetical protein M427DRAFT_70341 [Gonapodya prolifera JEL478]|eukprot:KXS15047.1 hypothetical protein M427DRAFT_70341 [Gonapodya prolifera JEL478]